MSKPLDWTVSLVELAPAGLEVLAASLNKASHLGDYEAAEAVARTAEITFDLHHVEAQALAHRIVYQHRRDLNAYRENDHEDADE